MASQKSRPLSVLVTGAGIAGPCFAYWLTRAGLDPKPNITVVERAPAPRTAGQSIDIRDEAVPIMHKMGLEQAIRSKTTPEVGTIFVDEKSKEIARFDASGNANNQSMTSEYEILRADLAKVFIDASTKRDGVSYVFGQRVVEISQDDSGVDVTFTGDLGTQRYDLVVAADGAMSKTRQAIFGPDQPSQFKYLGAYYAFFSIPYDSTLDEPPLWRWYNAPGLNISTRPHNNPSTSGAYMGLITPPKERNTELDEALAQGVEAQKKVCRKIFQGAGWQAERICDGMDKADDFYLTPITQVRIPKWSKGRCICLGDAAYCPTVWTGAGTSLAIEGAYLLAGEIATSGGEVLRALQTYEDLFRPKVEKTQKGRLPRIFNPTSETGLKTFRWFVKGVATSRVHKLPAKLGLPRPAKVKEYNWAPV